MDAHFAVSLQSQHLRDTAARRMPGSDQQWQKGDGVALTDGHTLRHALEQVEILTDQRPDLAVVDRGYRGHGETRTRVLISGTRRGLTPKLIADLRRRSAIEAEIGHMKTDGRLTRCTLKGSIGDALFAALCACGHNIRKILAHLRAWLAWIVATILNAACHQGRQDQAVTSA